jgi:DeoR family transcriptional regulator of aga operon
MLNVERRTKILELLEKQGQVAVVELSKRFKTSEVTIRNDLKALHARGLIRRAHGGAVKVATVSMDPSLKVKAELHADEKRRIGAAAAEMINDGDSIILDSGTTTHQIARRGPKNPLNASANTRAPPDSASNFPTMAPTAMTAAMPPRVAPMPS